MLLYSFHLSVINWSFFLTKESVDLNLNIGKQQATVLHENWMVLLI